jgi:TolB-like protein
MPFVNASGDSEVDYLSDGMTETLIKTLSQLPNLNVMRRLNLRVSSSDFVDSFIVT